ncbi:MAG TPA: alkaline phosphatase D family protein [Acidobacteriaceae bacterium]|nr:alkaline phosphatase D family protein [Acidobacteriaceae bacterium]
MNKRLDRRSFLKKAGGTAIGTSAWMRAWPALGDANQMGTSFRSAWPKGMSQPWPGPEYWANPLQDWRVQSERLECFSAGGDRNVALLTHEVSAQRGDLMLSVRLGKLDDAVPEEGFAGFRVGSKHAMGDYRAAAIYGRGLDAGIHADGRLFIGKLEDSAPKVDLAHEVRLMLHAEPSRNGYRVTLRAASIDGEHSAEVKREVPEDWLTGGLALVCCSAPVEATPPEAGPIHDFSFYPPNQKSGGTMRFWFQDWTVAGSKVAVHPERAYGPILFTLYTLSRGVLKLSAQFPPMGDAQQTATLQTMGENGWKTIATANLDPDAWNATFRVPGWDATRDWKYRVLFSMPDGAGQPRQSEYTGTIRRDPSEKPELKIGLLTCIWDFGFPHADFARHLTHHDPDILLWTGDQVYEPVGGFGAIQSRAPDRLVPAMLDFQRKWFIFGWAVRDLTRDIPSVCMTDDHDMYHGNIWGCGGRPTNPAHGTGAAAAGTVSYSHQNYAIQDSGGYKMAPRWVNMVQRLQTAHLPDPFDSTPVLQEIGVYYCDLRWGGISFAILEDRKWKSAPKPLLPAAGIVNGFALNPGWNTEAQSDDPDAELLGQRQLDFLEAWTADWSGGTWMKFAVSQTVFGCLHTEPPGVYSDDHDPEESIPPAGTYLEGDHLVADYDSNAWPQHERNAAIALFRKGFAMHLSGDQHLGSTSHYGIEEFRDGVYGVCTPAISSIWPRRWWPPHPGANAVPGTRNTGDYFDAFHNRMTVLAIANPAQYPGPGLDGLRLRATGFTILTCNRATRKTSVTLWPRWVDPSVADAKPYPGWPLAVDQIENGLWGARWVLNPVVTPEFQNPVVQVRDDSTGEILYTLRITGTEFTPHVRKSGKYTVIAFDPDGFFRKEWRGIEARLGSPAAG